MFRNSPSGLLLNLFRRAFLCLAILGLFLTNEISAVYKLRYTTTDNGGMLFTGNTLGLSKEANQNQPGPYDAIGTFITTDLSQKVGYYQPGTTLDWTMNSSTAILDLPEGSTVLYAELIWSGSYGFENQITGNQPNTPITLINPLGQTFTVTPDPTTSQVALTPGYSKAGNYTRSGIVTAAVSAGGAGEYTVGGIPATVSALDNTHNAAGWTLAVVFRNGSMPTSNLTLFVGCEQASASANPPASVTGFCTPSSGTLSGNLFISAIEGEANKTGDHMLFGSAPPLTIAANSLSGVNNPVNNFFASQINTLLPFNDREFVGSGQLDTRGSFGNFNANPFTGVILPGSRQGYDITSVDISDKLTYDQTTAYAQGTTTSDDYTINALGMQIQVGAPNVVITKSTSQTNAVIGDTLTFTFTIQNIGTIDADNFTFFDDLETNLQFKSGTFYIGATNYPLADPTSIGGVSIGTIIADAPETTVTFQVQVIGNPPTGNIFVNQASGTYNFQLCSGPIANLETTSNQVQIVLPEPVVVPFLDPLKLVNGSLSVVSSVGDVVTFSVYINNTGTGDALNVTFTDLVQDGLEVVPGSVLVDNVIVTPDPDLTAGFSLGNILVGQTVVVQFSATITSFPDGSLFYNSSTINYQYRPTSTTIVNADPETTNTVTINLLVPAIGFQGTIQECKYLNGTRYIVDTTWIQAYSTGVIAYRIYTGDGVLLATTPSTARNLRLYLSSRQIARNLVIRAVYEGNSQSRPYKIRIIK